MHWPSNACPHAHTYTLHRMPAPVLLLHRADLSLHTPPAAQCLAAIWSHSQAAAPAPPVPCLTPLYHVPCPSSSVQRQAHAAQPAPEWHDSSCLSSESACPAVQVEQRLRQLESKVQGSEGARPRGQTQPQKYDPARQGATGGLLTATKTYNPDADVAVGAPASVSEKKVRAKRSGCASGSAWCSAPVGGRSRRRVLAPHSLRSDEAGLLHYWLHTALVAL